MDRVGSSPTKKLATKGIVLTCCFIVAFLTAFYGKVETHSQHFNGQRKIVFVPQVENMKANIHINSNYRTSWVPFFDLHIRTKFPTTVRLQFWDSSVQLQEVRIKTIELHYNDGTSQSIPVDWSRKAKPYTMTYQNGKKDFASVWDNLPAVITQFRDVTIKLNGQLIYADGKHVSFETDPIHFEAKDHTKVDSYSEFILTIMLGA